MEREVLVDDIPFVDRFFVLPDNVDIERVEKLDRDDFAFSAIDIAKRDLVARGAHGGHRDVSTRAQNHLTIRIKPKWFYVHRGFYVYRGRWL